MTSKYSVAILRQALEDIVDPIAAMRRNLPDGAHLNGGVALSLSNDANYLKEIAKKALANTQP